MSEMAKFSPEWAVNAELRGPEADRLARVCLEKLEDSEWESLTDIYRRNSRRTAHGDEEKEGRDEHGYVRRFQRGSGNSIGGLIEVKQFSADASTPQDFLIVHTVMPPRRDARSELRRNEYNHFTPSFDIDLSEEQAIVRPFGASQKEFASLGKDLQEQVAYMTSRIEEIGSEFEVDPRTLTNNNVLARYVYNLLSERERELADSYDGLMIYGGQEEGYISRRIKYLPHGISLAEKTIDEEGQYVQTTGGVFFEERDANLIEFCEGKHTKGVRGEEAAQWVWNKMYDLREYLIDRRVAGMREQHEQSRGRNPDEL